jgi:anti-anti-sigma factor
MANIEFRVKVIKSPSGITGTLAEIEGSIDATTIQQFQQVMDKLVERGVKNLVLDCTSVKYINSTGLGTLLKYADTYEAMGGHIAFCRVPSKVMLVMEMLGFNALFNIVPDEATALRSFGGVAAPPATVPVKTEAPSSVQPAPQPAPFPQPAYVVPVQPQPALVSPVQPVFPQPVSPLQVQPIHVGPQPVIPVEAPSPVAALAAPVFPLHLDCARCRVQLEIPATGKFKCPRCNAVMAVEPTGRPRFFASRKTPPLEVTVPCQKLLTRNLAGLAGLCAKTLGFDEPGVHAVTAAVNDTCINVIDLAYGGEGNQIFHVLIHPNEKALTIRIADHGKPFSFGPTGIHGDPRFAAVISHMDTVEHRPNPRGGNLITLIKVIQ